jgi:hypothetical protein
VNQRSQTSSLLIIVDVGEWLWRREGRELLQYFVHGEFEPAAGDETGEWGEERQHWEKIWNEVGKRKCGSRRMPLAGHALVMVMGGEIPNIEK